MVGWLLVTLWLIGRAYAGVLPLPEFKVAAAQQYFQAAVSLVETQAIDKPALCLLRARLESQLGRQDAAERLARQTLEHEALRASGWSFLADLYIRQDRLEDAAHSLRAMLESDPKMAGGHYRLGLVLDRLGEHEEARKTYEIGLRLAPDDPGLHLVLGRWFLDQGQAQDAVVHLEKACQLNPESPNAFYVLAQAQNRMGDPEAGRKTLQLFQRLHNKEKASLTAENDAYDDAEHLRSLAANFHTEAATLLLQRHQAASAEAHLRQALFIAPEEVSTRELLLALHLEEGQFPAARTNCEELVRLRPKQASYRSTLARLFLQANDLPHAVEQLKETLALDPKQPEALEHLARCYLAGRQNLPEALALCQRLVALEPSAAHHDLLGRAAYANRRPEEARAACAQAVTLDPTNTVFQEHLRRLSPLP